MRRRRKVLVATISIVLFLPLFEIGLRIQQAAGPVVDLEFDWLDMKVGVYSDTGSIMCSRWSAPLLWSMRERRGVGRFGTTSKA